MVNKIEFQWRTLKKAFHDINLSKSGKIKPWELRYYLKHWGLEPSDQIFNEIFSGLDQDNDGVISYKDFKAAVGKIVNPTEELFFR